jgi:hypothetical protein
VHTIGAYYDENAAIELATPITLFITLRDALSDVG